ncbi:MAG: endonuclease/exonuclease/phosphatase family protein [Kiritimatiellae bacterium]|nr:endonuclease/exonuclease/phosphatase family protein [Kiritimatiellia bacterium]
MRTTTIVSLAVALVTAGCKTEVREVAQFRLLNWNVTHFSGGTATVATLRPDEGEAAAAKFSSFVESVGADVVGITEYDENFTTNGSMKSAEAVFRGYEPAVGPASGAQCNAIFFKSGVAAKMADQTVAYAKRYEDTYYKAVKLNIRGVPVWFVQTQLDWHTYLSGHKSDRIDQMKALIEAFKDEPYVVISGDFRVGIRIPGARCFPAPEEYRVFTDAGYELANLHGTGTYPIESPLQPIDNIIVKGLDISEVRFLEAGRLSSHLAVSCLLTTYVPKNK